MNMYRSAAVALTACAATLSLAACTAGITTASTDTTSPAAQSSSPASSSSSASASPALASRTIKLSGEAGSFPLPAGAKVAENVASPEGTIVFFNQVTPAKVSSFYAQALPRAGYTITANSVISQSGSNVAFIQFTGHAIKGTIDALAKFTDSSVSIAGLGHKNVTTISITKK
jgi:ABC-type phosphate transport system substrate-binding protein